jgi:acetolactate synthase-1/2/3 large subunit
MVSIRRARESAECALINVWIDLEAYAPGTMNQTIK